MTTSRTVRSRSSVWAAGLVGLMVGCTGAPSTSGAASSSDEMMPGGRPVTVAIDGHPRVAVEVEGNLLIEGDIVVGRVDSHDQAPFVEAEGALRSLGGFWPRDSAGVAWVPFTFDPSFSATDTANITTAMADITAVAPSIVFRPFVSGDASWIAFTLSSTACNSPLGRQGGGQVINLTTGCAASFGAHHEIFHSLGVRHEATRVDRDDFVKVAWSNMRGCTSTAASAADCGLLACLGNPGDCGCNPPVDDTWCNYANNFEIAPSNTNMFAYDFGSIMHYAATSFAKPLSSTLTLADGSPLPAGTGFLSTFTDFAPKDIQVIRALYPEPMPRDLFFADTGPQPACVLVGREQDANTLHSARRLVGGSWVTDSSVASDGFIDSDSLSPGATHTIECKTQSPIWSTAYPYPAWTTTSGTRTEVITVARTIRVANPGLIAVLFRP